jgi:NTE family protein
VLAFAGGNALGAYGAGAYEALHKRGYTPDVVSGASIGAVTGGIIAGNAPAQGGETARVLASGGHGQRVRLRAGRG